ncbi:MAG: alpha/beta hydrolase [Gammaproteobacteria bacterium]
MRVSGFLSLFAAGLLLALIGTACSAPAALVEQQATAFGFKSRTVKGAKFFHRIYQNRKHSDSGLLHVYIEGDGMPWLNADWISPDPTPRDPMMLKLMALDAEPAIYLGRPCYFGSAEDGLCHSRWWTGDRYSSAVVDSMATALNRVNSSDRARVVLIGHSGGGALAVLLAEGPIKAAAVVTLAGNLDTDARSRFHRYPDLSGSLNPAQMPSLDRRVRQLHFFGSADQNIPPALAYRFAAHQPHARFRIYQDFDHHCCWETKWREILQMISVLTRNQSNPKANAKRL